MSLRCFWSRPDENPSVCGSRSSLIRSGSRSVTSTSSTLTNSIFRKPRACPVRLETCHRLRSRRRWFHQENHSEIKSVTASFTSELCAAIIVNNSRHSFHITTGKRSQLCLYVFGVKSAEKTQRLVLFYTPKMLKNTDLYPVDTGERGRSADDVTRNPPFREPE